MAQRKTKRERVGRVHITLGEPYSTRLVELAREEDRSAAMMAARLLKQAIDRIDVMRDQMRKRAAS